MHVVTRGPQGPTQLYNTFILMALVDGLRTGRSTENQMNTGHMCPPGGGVADEERLPGLHGDGVREKPRWKH
jgi:hypothetical protein